jgi:hypothetical protein
MDPWIRLRRSELSEERPAGATEDVHFPERLAEQVIARFTTPGELVLDPFAGYGTTAVVAARMGRRVIAVELLPERAELIRSRLGDDGRVIVGDARRLRTLVREPIDLCFTSPPYMTRTGHPENPLTGYRTLDGKYDTYLDEMEAVAFQVAELLNTDAGSSSTPQRSRVSPSQRRWPTTWPNDSRATSSGSRTFRSHGRRSNRHQRRSLPGLREAAVP